MVKTNQKNKIVLFHINQAAAQKRSVFKVKDLTVPLLHIQQRIRFWCGTTCEILIIEIHNIIIHTHNILSDIPRRRHTENRTKDLMTSDKHSERRAEKLLVKLSAKAYRRRHVVGQRTAFHLAQYPQAML